MPDQPVAATNRRFPPQHRAPNTQAHVIEMPIHRRSYTFNESQVLARDLQEQRLLREMQTDAIQQIVRRLQTAKKPS